MNRLDISPPDLDGLMAVRLSDQFRNQMGEILQCVPKIRDGSRVKQGAQILSFETNRCMTSVKSPIAGEIFNMNLDLIERKPTEITSETILFWVLPK